MTECLVCHPFAEQKRGNAGKKDQGHAHAWLIQELQDQRAHLKLIASENYSSLAVQLAMGNLFTDKYAEGYPHHRFYAGCENVDHIESLAQEELMKLYQSEHAYVQPHSGAEANLVALWAILIQRIQNPAIEKLGKKTLDELTPEEYETVRQSLNSQTLMGMSLHSGGHLTHGYRHNVSSKFFRSRTYDVDRTTELLDYAALNRQVQQEKPTILLAGYSAYPRRLNFAKFREIADEAGAVLMVDMAHFAGLVAGGVFKGEENPVPYAHLITSTTHKTLRGPRGGFVLSTKEFAESVNKGCPVVLGGPLPHVIASKLVAFREASRPEFKLYAQKVVDNAHCMAEEFRRLGLRLVSGGTDNHLLIIDVSKLGLTGRQAEQALREASIIVNKNTIPFDQEAWYASGIRIGTPAMTTLGMGREEMKEIARLIYTVLSQTKPGISPKTGLVSKATSMTPIGVIHAAKQKVGELLQRFPLYPEIELD